MPHRDNPRVPELDFWRPASHTQKDTDVVFACLANHQRRLLVECVSENPGPLVVEEVVQCISEREDRAAPDARTDSMIEITTTLHNHLPKLDEAGIITVDHETNTVKEGNRFDVATSLLEWYEMELVMCRSCGEFVQAFSDGDDLWPSKDEYPECGGTEFKDNRSGRTIDTEKA